jgi:hypothetical protein
MSEDRYFGAPWGTLLKVVSSLVTLLLLGFFIVLIKSTNPLSIVPLVIAFVCLLFTVRGYTVSGDTLLVKRLLWNTVVDIGMVRSVKINTEAMTGSIRTFGNGGLYSFSGQYRSGKLGFFRAYVTDFKNCVVIETAGNTIVVSPENPELFTEVLRNTVHGT